MAFQITLYRIESGPYSLELSDQQMRHARIGRFEFDGASATLSDLHRRVEEEASIPHERQEYHCLSGRKLKWQFDGRVALAEADGFEDSMNLLDVMDGYVREGISAHNYSIGVRFLPISGGRDDGGSAQDDARLDAMRAVVGAAEARTVQGDLGGVGGAAAAMAAVMRQPAGLSVQDIDERSQKAHCLPSQRARADAAMAMAEPSRVDGSASASTQSDPSDLRIWLRDLDRMGSNSGRFERYASAFEREFDRLGDVALSAEQEGVDGILKVCNVTTMGDRARIRWAIEKLSQPD